MRSLIQPEHAARFSCRDANRFAEADRADVAPSHGLVKPFAENPAILARGLTLTGRPSAIACRISERSICRAIFPPLHN